MKRTKLCFWVYMLSSGSKSQFGRFVQKIEFKLLMVLLFIGEMVYVGIKTRSVQQVIFTYISFLIIFGLIYFWYELLMFLLTPFFLIYWPFENFLVKRYCKKQNFKHDINASTVVVLGHSNWFTFEGWSKPIFSRGDIKQLVKTIKAERRDFSFYLNAKFSDVEKIMSDKNVEEVYFFGHGNSHIFQLGTDEILYYCDFNNPKYNKKFVHQVHCGDPYSKSLIDYVVPKENRAKCFLFRKTINSFFIQKELKKREKIALLEK